MKRTLVAAALAVAAAAYAADEQSVQLKAGPGRDQVVGYCSTCHSLDYIQANSPFLTKQGWQAEVAKMIKAYGAQIPQDAQPAIVDYLATNYGATPPPAK